MSDQSVERLLQELADWLEPEPFDPDEVFLNLWIPAWQKAVQEAERGPEWAALVARSQELAERVRARLDPLLSQRDVVVAELRLQSVGQRALKGYQTGTQRV